MPFYLQSSRDRFRRYKRELARQLKTGAAEIAPSADAVIGRPTTRHRSFFQLLGRFLGLLRGLRGRLVLALCTLTIATLLNLAPPAATKVIVDYVLITDPDNPMPVFLTDVLRLPSDPPLLLGAVALAIVGIAVVSITVGMWGRWQATKTTKRLQVAVRRRVFEHTVRLPLHRVYALKSGGVTSILREDAGGVGELVFGMVYNPWRAIIQLAGTLAILAVVDWRLLLPSLLLIPAVYLTQRNWVARVRPLHRNIRATRQHVDTHATEAFGGMRVVRAFGRQRSESNRFTRNNHLMARQELHAWWWARSVDIAWSLLIPVASAVLLWYGGRQVLGGAMSPGDLVMFLAYLAMLLGPLATLAVSAAQFQNGLAALDRVLDLLAEPVEMAPQPGAVVVQPAQVAARITLRDVGFVYRGSGIRVIDAISLDVEPGETVALVGRSGAGKTTLCNLIARFYDPIDGVIELDGTDLRDINVESYRRLLGIVEQDIFLFDGTVADNIGYARRGASTSEIVEVARLAHAHEFITELDDGYDTLIGERGVRLSGGQRQRLAIARAMLADPRILILDEATSNLDTESERYIQASLGELMRDRTSFVIAHRLSTVTDSDRIVLLEAGRIVDQGPHSELLQQSEMYRQMVFMQFQGDAGDSNGEKFVSIPESDVL
ncbi:MAG: ABC transporter ATP-binding protein [Planctomycetota bacterium]|jgi:ATP-binding cassette subfamily B protein/subfamily B ATP-binding cassette protein MsbA